MAPEKYFDAAKEIVITMIQRGMFESTDTRSSHADMYKERNQHIVEAFQTIVNGLGKE